jgi:hypothetical protein
MILSSEMNSMLARAAALALAKAGRNRVCAKPLGRTSQEARKY